MKRQSFIACISIVVLNTWRLGAAVAQVQQIPAQQPIVAQAPVQNVQVQSQEVADAQAAVPQPEQERVPEIPQDQQYFLPALLKKRKILQVGANPYRDLSVSVENRIAFRRSRTLHICDIQGHEIRIPCLTQRSVLAYSFVAGRDLFVALADGTVYSLSVDSDKLKGVVCAEAPKGMLLSVIDRESYAIAPQHSNSVSVRFAGSSEIVFSFRHPIDLMTSDGKNTFVFANKNNPTITIVSKGKQAEQIPLGTCPTAIAISDTGSLYVGTREGKVLVADARPQRAFIPINTGSLAPVTFLAVFSDIFMVAHKNEAMLQVFSRINHRLLYSIRLSNVPIQQIAVNPQGTIVCIDQDAKMRIWSIDTKAVRNFSALMRPQRELLQTLIALSQKREISPEMLEQEREKLALIPKNLVANVQRMSPKHGPTQGVLDQADFCQEADLVGRRAAVNPSMFGKLQRNCGRCFGHIKDFVRNHTHLSLAIAITVTYLILQRATSKKPITWLSYIPISQKKTGKLGFLWM